MNQEVVANVESGSSIDFENNNNNPVDTAQVTGSEEKKQKTYDEIRDERRSLWYISMCHIFNSLNQSLCF